MQKPALINIVLKAVIILIVLITGSASLLKAQETDDIMDDLLFNDDAEFDKIFDFITNYQLLYTSVNYNNNTYFAGRDLGFDQYNLTPQLFY